MNTRGSNHYNERELRVRPKASMKLTMEEQEVKPQALDHWYREVIKVSRSWLSRLSRFSKVRRLRSLQIFHIKHVGTRFQIEEECFPNQFCQANKRSKTRPDNTQWTPKVRNTKFHNPPAIGQCNKRWLVVSPPPWHIPHHSAITYPLCWRLSLVRIFPHAAVQTKKLTLLGAFIPQTLFQGYGPTSMFTRNVW